MIPNLIHTIVFLHLPSKMINQIKNYEILLKIKVN